jgi:ribonuclease VapC
VIVVDTSALMALLLSEPSADEIADALAGEEQIVISAGTLAEALIVAARRGVAEELEMLLSGIGIEVDSVTAAGAAGVAEAYDAWGRGRHPAGSILETVSRM